MIIPVLFLIGLLPLGRAIAAPGFAISVTSTPSPFDYTAAGQTITYTYVVTDFSLDNADSIVVTDDKVSGISCPSTTLATGASMNCTGSYITTAADVAAASMTNTVTVNANISTDHFPDMATATSTVTFTPLPSWSLSKTPNPATYTGAGETINYGYTLTNTGNVAINSITVTDDKVATVTCPATTLAVGANMTCAGSYVITAADVSAGSVTNTATAHGTPATGGFNFDPTATATVNWSAVPSWTLSKTASPVTYTGAGENISYTYTLTNTGNESISGITVADDKVATVSCAAATLAVGATTTCTGNYVITAADVSAGSVTNTATAHGTVAAGFLPDATAMATVVANKGSITIVVTSAGGDAAFQFDSTVAGAKQFSLTTDNGRGQRVFTSLDSGTYSFTEAVLPLHWELSSLSCSGDNGGLATTIDVDNRTVSIGLDGGEAITCTFSNVFNEALHRLMTKRIIRDFMGHRLLAMANAEPDRARIVRRIPGALWGGDGENGANEMPMGAFSLSGNSRFRSSWLSFATSLSRIEQVNGNGTGYHHPRPATLSGSRGVAPLFRRIAKSGLDVWFEGHYETTSDTDSESDFTIIYLGADYLLSPSVLVGALVQHDWMDEHFHKDTARSRISGDGTMAGPYLSTQLMPNLFFDLRTAWGSSGNTVNPFGEYSDGFTTDRWLLNARLTGNTRVGNYRVTPSMAVNYIRDSQGSYIDSLGVVITE